MFHKMKNVLILKIQKEKPKQKHAVRDQKSKITLNNNYLIHRVIASISLNEIQYNPLKSIFVHFIFSIIFYRSHFHKDHVRVRFMRFFFFVMMKIFESLSVFLLPLISNEITQQLASRMQKAPSVFLTMFQVRNHSVCIVKGNGWND